MTAQLCPIQRRMSTGKVVRACRKGGCIRFHQQNTHARRIACKGREPPLGTPLLLPLWALAAQPCP